VVPLNGIGVCHLEEGVEGGLDAAAAGAEHGLDDAVLNRRECFLQHLLALLLLGQWPGRLRRRSIAGRGGGRVCRGGCCCAGLVGGVVGTQRPLLLNVVVVHLERSGGGGRFGSRLRLGLCNERA
jgi:hypothetical protein